MKKLLKLLFGFAICISLTGCIKLDDFEGANIYTTVYPIEYVTEKLYGEYGNVESIYPAGVDTNTYKLNETQLKKFSKGDLFIFSGSNKEVNYVTELFNYNKRLKIIDSTQTIEYTYSPEELWLDPSNLLMITKNIKNGLNEYIDSEVMKNKILKNYEDLELELSNLDAKIKLIIENADKNTIIVSSDLFKYLEKYGLNVISLEENDNLTAKTINDAKNLIKQGKVKYIFLKYNEKENSTITSIKNELNIETINLHTLANLSDSEKSDKKDYFSIMNDNLDLLKKEIYN